MTPEGRVFAGGSYFPPEPRHGLPAFRSVLADALKRYRSGDTGDGTRSGPIAATAAQQVNGGAVGDLVLFAQHMIRTLLDNVDPIYGGFGTSAPRFPQPALHELLWRGYARTGSTALRDATVSSLVRICRSGLFDPVGGGFHRYCVDEAWEEPHFEKMLYGNAQMIELLTWAWHGTGSPLFAETVEQTIDWAVREMLLPSGAFASSMGAYVAGAGHAQADEGSFYRWRRDEIRDVLGEQTGEFLRAFEIGSAGTLLRRDREIDPQVLAECRSRLLETRTRRTGPERDEKVLADWNGLMITALVEAGQAFRRPDWIDLARSVIDRLTSDLADGLGLRHCVTAGQPGPDGQLEDYAQLSRAALRLHEVLDEPRYLDQAEGWVACLNMYFWDEAQGGYFTTAEHVWRPAGRLRTITETSLPTGNAVMVGLLGRLFELTGDGRYHDRAERILSAFRSDIVRYGIAAAGALNSAMSLDEGLRLVVTGDARSPDMQDLLRVALDCCIPDRIVLKRDSPGNSAMVQVCIGTLCLAPVRDAEELRRLIAPGGLSRAALGT